MQQQPDLKQRLFEAEATIEALRTHEVDAVVGADEVMVLRLREAEQKLRDSEQRFRILVEASSQAVWESDPDGLIVEESSSWLEYTGQAPGEALGEGWLDAVHPDHLEHVQRQWREAVASETVFNTEFRLRGPDGSWRWTHVHAAPIRDLEGKISKWIGMNLDITQRKTAEEKLQNSKERYQKLFNSIDEGFCVIEILLDDNGQPKDYRWLETNPAFERHTGLMNAIGKTARQLVPGLEDKWVETYGRVALTGKHEQFVEQSRAMGRWFEVDAFRIGEPGDLQVALLFTDITHRKRTEQALRESEQLFRDMADAAPAMLWVTDEKQQCTFLSRGWYEYTGQTEAESLGRGWINAVHPNDREHSLEIFLKAAQNKEPFEFFYRLRSIDGEYRWTLDVGRPRFDAQGKFCGYIGSVFDVHESKIGEEKLRQSEERFRIATDAVSGVIYEYDTASGITQRSSGLYKVTGFHPDEVPANAAWWRDRIHGDDRELLKEAFSAAMAGDGRLDCEYRLLHKSGRWIHIWDQAIILKDQKGRPVRVVGCAVDVTAQKEFEESLQHAREAAEAASRSRGEFLANMSHEIRTPMTAILGHADILADHLKDPDNLQCVETIRRNGKFLLEVINDILDLSKIDAGRLRIENESIRPELLLAEVIALMDVRAKEKGLPLEIKFETQIPQFIETDAVRLRQILLNLISNAIKFTQKGKVCLMVRYHPQQHRLQLDVVDTGIGIPSKELNSLFLPFTQADASATREFGGTGLGLTISRRLARALGGDISVISSEGKGSTFTLTITCGVTTSKRLVWPSLDPPPDSQISQKPVVIEGKILVVDDRRDILFLAQRFIEEAGGEVITAGNGLEALDIISPPGGHEVGNIDLVLMDMQMPRMDGYEATRRLRQKGYQRPIIALTANAMSGDRDLCLKAGCTDYISKPLNGRHLVRMIHHYLQALDG